MILSMGEALIDLTEDPDGRFTAHPGGAPANVAVTLARLGAPAYFAGRLGDSLFGKSLRRHLKSDGVDLALTEPATENQTLAVVGVDNRGAASYTFYTDGTADWNWTAAGVARIRRAKPAAFHFGSVASAVEPSASLIARLAQEFHQAAATVTSLDVNIRPALADAPDRELHRIERLVRYSNLVKASDDDLRWLSPDESPDEVAGRWARRGAIVLLTLGGDGVQAFFPSGERVAQPARRVVVADTIGAGDAFCAAVLTALWERHALGGGGRLLSELPLEAWEGILTFAATVASLTCERFGADPPGREEVEAVLRLESLT